MHMPLKNTELLFYISFLWQMNAWDLGLLFVILFYFMTFLLGHRQHPLDLSAYFCVKAESPSLLLLFFNVFPFCCLLAGVSSSVENKSSNRGTEGMWKELSQIC